MTAHLGCGGDATVGPEDPQNQPNNNATTGLPCEVAEVLSANCLVCHGNKPVEDAFSLTNRSDWSAAVASAALIRIRDAQAPMPPGGLMEEPLIVILESWIQDGMPSGTCVDGPDEFSVDPVCTSDKYWKTQGEEEGDKNMLPGQACISCHEEEKEGPDLLFAGTVYPTAHEPDNCYGFGGEATIEVTDADGRILKAPVLSSGNFMREGEANDPEKIRFPITARVIVGDMVREMTTAVDSGDCNACHTQDGTEDAPGRILVP